MIYLSVFLLPNREAIILSKKLSIGLILAAALVVISQIVLGILRKLNFTQMWVKKLTEKGYPRWLFFLITSSNVKHLSEKRIFHSMVSILIVNFLILFMLFCLF